MNTKNGRLTLAKLEQKLEDHLIQQEKDFEEVKENVKDIKISVNDIKGILIAGEGKIKRNFMLISTHVDYHWKMWAGIGTIITLIATIISVAVGHL